ncbi:MAG: putative colanic acid biosynthesis acetyltransferase, partial [Hyphomicrobiales bacterium]
DNVILYALGNITLGKSVTISQNAHLCAGSHDYRDAAMTLTKPPITVGEGVWVCADAFIAPNTIVGERAIVAARAVVVKDVAAKTIVGGNPAKKIGLR